MYFVKLLSVVAFAAGLTLAQEGATCGYKYPECPKGYTCELPKYCQNPPFGCVGKCVKDEPPANEYPPCGGFRPKPLECEKGSVCIDDPRVPGCGMACDRPGICVTDPPFCGGIAGIRCPEGLSCYDMPNDGCDPANGGADCGGICL